MAVKQLKNYIVNFTIADTIQSLRTLQVDLGLHSGFI